MHYNNAFIFKSSNLHAFNPTLCPSPRQELEDHKEVISQLEEENRQLSEKIGRIEHNLAEETAAHYDAMAKIDMLKAKVNEVSTVSTYLTNPNLNF